jgi:hypothetical protein
MNIAVKPRPCHSSRLFDSLEKKNISREESGYCERREMVSKQKYGESGWALMNV